MDPVMLSLVRAGSSFALDVLLCPIPKIMKFHMMPERGLAIGLIFALRGFWCVVAAARLAIVRQTIAAAASAKPDALAARESLVRSVRSVLSLFSGQGSNDSGRSNRSKGSKLYGAPSGSGAGSQGKNVKEIMESEIDLNDISKASESNSVDYHERVGIGLPGGRLSRMWILCRRGMMERP
ncbi:hypothetical protein K469DRAFT_683757 [Zopfia rhizophila CBS 207.26]|uniref:Uncharacterized protein n=1 Tax=Zopfia rhizophila CBS 207.26 TaxID=1314779 RepID=A0A6A6EDR0_9PEZI|nr:hypothetical protein K469DRAFT_683757 [Zopfia rhizophila CBS 207.26]